MLDNFRCSYKLVRRIINTSFGNQLSLAICAVGMDPVYVIIIEIQTAYNAYEIYMYICIILYIRTYICFFCKINIYGQNYNMHIMRIRRVQSKLYNSLYQRFDNIINTDISKHKFVKMSKRKIFAILLWINISLYLYIYVPTYIHFQGSIELNILHYSKTHFKRK